MNIQVTFAKQNHRPWDQSEFDTLIRMNKAGKDDVEIAAAIGRRRQQVLCARRKLGIQAVVPLRVWTSDQIDQLEILYEKGLTDKQIGAAIGRSPDAVFAKREVLGLMRRAAAEPQPALAIKPCRSVLAVDLMGQRPCPINADFEERARANAAYLMAGMRAGHAVYFKGRGPE